MRVLVIGGGISGLASAFRLKQRLTEAGVQPTVTLVEAQNRLGGTMFTEKVNGFHCEWGPNGFLDSKPFTVDLCKDLGLEDRLLRADEAAARRFVLLDGELVQLPTSPQAFMKSPLLTLGGRFRVIREQWVSRRPDALGDESVADFATRRLGVQAAERLIDPFVSGIYAGDPACLSVGAAFPRLVEMEREYGSLIKASRALKKAGGTDGGNSAGPSGRLTSFPNGMSELVEALEQAIGPENIRISSPVSDVRPAGGEWFVQIGEQRLVADMVVMAVPAHAAAQVLAPLGDQLTGPMRDIAYAAVSVVVMGFKKSDMNHALNGFGFLAPSREERSILGCLWTSSIFPGHRAPPDHALLRVMIGGARHPLLSVKTDAELLSSALRELRELLGLHNRPSFFRVFRHKSAIPQYEMGHLSRIQALDAALGEWPGLYLAGNAYRGVAVNDCTREADRLATQVVESIKQR